MTDPDVVKIVVKMPVPLTEVAALLTRLADQYERQGPRYNHPYAKTPKVRATANGDLELFIASEYESA